MAQTDTSHLKKGLGEMKQSKFFVTTVIAVSVIAAAVFASHMPGIMGHNMGRHMQGMMQYVPKPYNGMKNALPAAPEVIAIGARLYKTNCSACHGSSGRGDGPAGQTLSPRPSDLVHLMQMPLAQDDYLFWAISDGGKRFDTAMPAFNEVLDEQARWQIIHYLRTL